MLQLPREKPGSSSEDSDPWQILLMAVLFFLPAVFLLAAQGYGLAMANHGFWGGVEVVSPAMRHAAGVFMLLASAWMVHGYFRIRREIRGGSRGKRRGERRH